MNRRRYDIDNQNLTYITYRNLIQPVDLNILIFDLSSAAWLGLRSY